MTLYDYLNEHKDIMFDSGINWGNLYTTDPQEVEDIKALLTDRYSVTGPCDTLPVYESSAINNIFCWFTNGHKPTVKEKEHLLKWLDKVETSHEHTGISECAYPQLRERLEAMTDLEDKPIYNIHYHY